MAQEVWSSAIKDVTRDDVYTILTLRLLLARAANKDSLSWWDDESLTSHAGFLLERIFPLAPALAARSLALSAAAARHRAACASHENALHLYRLDLDSQDALALRSVPLLSIPLPQEPLPSIDALKPELLDLLGKPAPYVPWGSYHTKVYVKPQRHIGLLINFNTRLLKEGIRRYRL